ncbi:putative ABC transporter ATP-binding protein, partial [Haemophilus influenzae]
QYSKRGNCWDYRSERCR